MANKIRISTSELEAQAAKLNELSNNLNDISVKANKALSLIDDALDSIFFTTTMVPKSLKLRGNIALLIDDLNTGSKVAHQCATSFQNADVVLRKTIEESLPKEIYNSSASTQEVVKHSPQEKAIKKINSLTDGTYHTLGYAHGYNYDCYAYAKWVFNQMYGTNFGSQAYPNWRLAANDATHEIGSVSRRDKNLSKSNLSSLLSSAKSGDVLQLVWYPFNDKNVATPHTFILKEVLRDENGNVTGITTLEGNNKGFLLNENDGFPKDEKYGRQHYYSIDTLYSLLDNNVGGYGGGGLSVNRANNYDSVWK